MLLGRMPRESLLAKYDLTQVFIATYTCITWCLGKYFISNLKYMYWNTWKPVSPEYSATTQFTGVMSAVKEGHLANLNAALEQHEQVDGWHLSFQWANFDQVFIKWGIFLILEKLKMITYRNLFKRVKLWYLIILIFKFSGDPGAEEPPDFHPVLHLCSQADGGRKWKDALFCKIIQLK